MRRGVIRMVVGVGTQGELLSEGSNRRDEERNRTGSRASHEEGK
jgi:hypothetical protein